MRKILLILCASVFFAACGGAAGTGSSGLGKFSMDFKTLNTKTDVKKDFEVKKGLVTPLAITLDSKPIVRYIIDVTDFDFDNNSSSAKPKDDKQTAIEISLFGDSGDTVDSPLKVKTFELSASSAKVDEKYGKVSNVIVKVFKDGKVEETSLTYNAKGTVKINSVSGDTVSGEVDITQDTGGKLKGNFTAQMRKKQ